MRGPYFDPGRLRHDVELQQAVRVADALGGHAESWEPAAAVWAHLEPASAGPLRRADSEEADITHRIIMRMDDRVRRGMRLVTGNRILTIRTVRDLDGTGRYIECLTREQTP